MRSNKVILLIFTVLIICVSCTNTRYMTDQVSTKRQHDMRDNRTGGNMGDISINFANFLLAAALNITYETYSGKRDFKRISIVNQSTDSLQVNMVTDVVWKETGYCDIMGIVLPPGAKQKLLVPYPAAYNVYFKTSNSEEEKLEIRTDIIHRNIYLIPGMTIVHP